MTPLRFLSCQTLRDYPKDRFSSEQEGTVRFESFVEAMQHLKISVGDGDSRSGCGMVAPGHFVGTFQDVKNPSEEVFQENFSRNVRSCTRFTEQENEI